MSDDGKHDVHEHAEGEGRRSFIGFAALIGAAIGAMLGFPAGTLFAAPLLGKKRLGTESWVTLDDLGPVSELGEERKEIGYTFEHQDGWYTANRTRRVVVFKDRSNWVVMSTECTHMGCGVTWAPEEKLFICPCHNGRFDEDGKPVSGPVSKPLVKLESRINADGKIEVKEA